MSPASTPPQRSKVRILAWAYIAVAFVGTIALTIALTRQAVQPFVFLLWLLFLGPIGLVAAVLSVGTGLNLGALAGASELLAAGSTVLYTGGALLNVVLLRHLHRADARATRRSAPAQHQTVTAVLYLCAGAGFVLLCFLSGFIFIAAYGIDVPNPAAIRTRTQLLAGASWSIGLAAAVTGLVIWIRGRQQEKLTLPWAITDLAVVTTMTALVLVVGQISLN